jgi:iron complex transport system substrate-binding protein
MSPRLVSLVPSLTETLYALGAGDHVAGVTKFCIRPKEAREHARVLGGTKDPDVGGVIAMRPDLVLCDKDENKPEDIQAMEAAGLRVHTTHVESLEDAVREIVAIGAILGRGVEAEGWAQRIRAKAAQWRDVASMARSFTVFVPIWRKPLMTMNGATYMSDLLKIAGAKNLFASARRSYFEVGLDEVRQLAPEGVLLPTEPYRFGKEHVAEFADKLGLEASAVEIIDGQALTWFGTGALEGLDVVAETVGRLRSRLENP